MIEYGIFDYLTDPDVEAEVLGADAAIRCFACTDEDALPDEIETLTAAMLWHNVTITERTLRRLRSCRAVVRVGVGFDNVDYAAAGALGIPVVNVPDYGTNDVADHAFALLLTMCRKLHVYNEAIRSDPAGAWEPGVAGEVRRLTGTTLGLVGLGRIGAAVARRAQAFGMRVAFYDPYLPDGYDKTFQVQRCDSLGALVEMSDYLSLHAPLTEETRGMVGRELLRRCKPGMTLVNTARGGIVVLDAVYEALSSGRLRAFAADVLEREPPDPAHPLLAAYAGREAWLDGRVFLTPHAAFYAEESRRELRVKAAQRMLQAARGEPLRNCVNTAYLVRPRTSVVGFAGAYAETAAAEF